MPKQCPVCVHSERHDIEKALISGEALRQVAQRFALSYWAVFRHKRRHLPERLMKAQDAQEIIQADSLLGQMLHLQDKALTILRMAEAAGDLKTALGAIREARGNLELLVRLQIEHGANGPDGVADRGIVIQVIGERAKQLSERIIAGERTEQPVLPQETHQDAILGG